MANLVTLYFNSRDRASAAQSSTDYTVSLRKAMRNIESVQLSNVVIPQGDTLVNVNNNTLRGTIVVDDTATPFVAAMRTGNYSPDELAAEFSDAMTGAAAFVAYGMVWTAAYDPVTRRIAISADYPGGAAAVWSITFSYTRAIDVVGIGDITPAPKTYDAEAGSTTLVVPTLRAPTLQAPLYYSVTSAALSAGVNASYLQSGAKLFVVGASNNTIAIDVEEKVARAEFVLPLGAGAATQASFGLGVDVSSNGNIVVACSDFGWAARYRMGTTGPWDTAAAYAVPNVGSVTDVAISGDGSTVAVVGQTDGGAPGLWIWTRVGFAWTFRVGPMTPDDVPGNTFTFDSVGLSGDGNVVVVGAAGVDASEAGATWVYAGDGIQDWQQRSAALVGLGAIGDAGQGTAVAIALDGYTIATGGPLNDAGYGRVWTWTTPGPPFDTWNDSFVFTPTMGVSGLPRAGRSVAFGGSTGGVLAIGGPLNDGQFGGAWIYRRTVGVWGEEAYVQGGNFDGPAQQGSAVALSGDGTLLGVGGARDALRRGAAWAFRDAGGGFWQQQWDKLVGSGAAGQSLQGAAVALSGDGSAMIVGGPGDDGDVGAVWGWALDVGWTQVGLKMTLTTPGTSRQGAAVALSEDTLVAAVSGPFDDAGVGALWIWRRVAGSPYFGGSGNKLVPVDVVGPANVGLSLSIGGGYVAAGGPLDDSHVGAAWLWGVGGALIGKLVGAGGTGTSQQGAAVSLDGVRLAVGGPGDNAGVGAVWIWQAPWTTADVPLIGGGGIGAAAQGSAVAIVGDVLAVGGPEDDLGAGAVWIWRRVNGAWAQNAVLLVGAGATGAASQGSAISMVSPVAGVYVLAVGGPANASFVGGTWVWMSVDGAVTWTQMGGGPLVGTGYVGAPLQGTSVSLNGEGTLLVVGGNADSGGSGAVWAWRRAVGGGVWVQSGGPFVSPGTSQLGSGVSAGSNSFLAGAPSSAGDVGSSSWFVLEDSFAEQYTCTVPPRSYSIMDLVATLPDVLVLRGSPSMKLLATYDDVTSVVTLTMDSAQVGAIFRVVAASTFDVIQWGSGAYGTVAASEPVDLSLNTNVVGTIVDHSSSGFYVEREAAASHRKYPAGYTLGAGFPIDIQLRDDRESIVDLEGAEWAFTATVAINS
jgi:hypothetical protein